MGAYPPRQSRQLLPLCEGRLFNLIQPGRGGTPRYSKVNKQWLGKKGDIIRLISVP